MQNGFSTSPKVPCICGCNTPILRSQRHPGLDNAEPIQNFKSSLATFLQMDNLPIVQLPSGDQLDFYHLFHCILSVKQKFSRIRWRVVTRMMELDASQRSERRVLRRSYSRYLKAFDTWIHERGPVKIGCVDKNIVINILKEFVPGLKPIK